jgi:hypothetical protein
MLTLKAGLRPVPKYEYSQRRLRVKAYVTSPVALPEYLEMCTRYLCDHQDLTCAQTMLVPPLEEQRYILTAMHKVAMETDIEGLQSVFIKLLIHHDMDAVSRLVELATTRNTVTENIRHIVEYSNSLPIHFSSLFTA